MHDEPRMPRTMTDLLARLQRGRAELEQTIAGLSEQQMTARRDAAGWSARDHLVHLTAWERSIVYLLQRRPRHEGLGVEQALYLHPGPDFVAVNAAIVEQARDRSVAEVLAGSQAVHADLLAALAGLTDADLQRPYVDYAPDEPGDGPGRPVVEYIVDNSYAHYQEHLPWLQALL